MNENTVDQTQNINDELEKTFYKSCLKQVVNFLNSTLPSLSDENVADLEPKTKEVKYRITKKTTGIYGVKDSKKIKKAILLEMKAVDKINSKKQKKTIQNKTEEQIKKKRINKFSEEKYNNMKKDKKLKKTQNSGNKKQKEMSK